MKAIATLASASTYLYGTDGDVSYDVDPLTNTYDMSDDPMAFARKRVKVVQELMSNLTDRLIDDGESYQKARDAFFALLWDLQRNLYIPSRYVGGYFINRDQKGDPDESPSLEPVCAEVQREALNYITDTIFCEETYQLDPVLLSRLAPNRWDHWGAGNPSTVEVPIHDRILTGQMMVVRRLFAPETLRRIHDYALYSKKDDDRLTMDEVYEKVTSAIWSEVETEPESECSTVSPFITSFRRDLQRAYLDDVLLNQVISPSSALPEDARALAWMTLKSLKGNLDNFIEKQRGMTRVKLMF